MMEEEEEEEEERSKKIENAERARRRTSRDRFLGTQISGLELHLELIPSISELSASARLKCAIQSVIIMRHWIYHGRTIKRRFYRTIIGAAEFPSPSLLPFGTAFRIFGRSKRTTSRPHGGIFIVIPGVARARRRRGLLERAGDFVSPQLFTHDSRFAVE